MSALLSVRDLEVAFPIGGLLSRLRGGPADIRGVAGVSFDLAAGETLALVGESGSGKTTLARAVAGLGRNVSGNVTFEGKDILAMDAAARHRLRRDVSFIFQDAVSSLSPRLTVRQLLEEPFRIHGETPDNMDAKIADLLDLVSLPPAMADRRPHELSGGQARRVGVARALALDPKLIIADEPTAGLDVSVQGEVLNLLNDLRERLGLALLVITHNLNIVRHIADRMAIMYLGRFVELGETDTVFHDPRHPYTAALLSANPVVDPEAAPERITLEGEMPSLLRRPAGCEFHGRCPFARELCRTHAPEVTQDAARRFTCHYPVGVASFLSQS
ncbi:ABC transporter ATP-binding protein [Marivita sp. GX14005]|uniref:ABC transporter ATP-binding protein n=1 Tax=Marivita sp. GX14005 TaxID=2942276 RepID=UPI00201A0BFA|nr:ABC transporter ATP-binding protein [Marivita sp. GX14005]MCL3883388.1 ABC transporter ATP-binding protein [Marivita sp. GX14005]